VSNLVKPQPIYAGMLAVAVAEARKSLNEGAYRSARRFSTAMVV